MALTPGLSRVAAWFKQRLEIWSTSYVKPVGVRRFMVAVAITAGMLLARIYFNTEFSTIPYMPFIAGVFLASLYGGFGAGLLVWWLESLAQIYFFFTPALSFSVHHLRQDWIGLISFSTLSAIVISLVSALRYARRAASRTTIASSRLAALVGSSQDAIIGKTLDGIITDWNDGACKLYGYTAAEVIGQNIRLLAPPTRWPDIDGYEERLRQGKRVEPHETLRIRKDGSLVPVEISISPIQEGNGEVVGGATIARDISERHRREEEQQFLRQANQLLVSSIDYQQTLETITDLAVPVLADWCAIDLVGEGQINRVNFVHREPGLKELAQVMKNQPPWPADYPHGVPLVIRTGEAELVPDITDRMLAQEVADPQRLDLIRKLGLISQLVVPLKTRGQVIGAVSLAFGRSGRHYSHKDLSLVESFAATAAAAIENAKLYRQTLVSRDQLAFLVRANQVLSSSIDYEKSIIQLAQMVVPEIADWCTVYILENSGQSARRLTISHANPAKVEIARRVDELFPYRPGNGSGLDHVIKTGEPFVSEPYDLEALRPALNREQFSWLHQLQLLQSVTVPLKSENEVVGVIQLVMGESKRKFTDNDLNLARNLAAAASAAIENSRLYSETARTADQLRAIFANVADGLTVMDGDARLLFANDVAAQMSGFENWREFVNADRKAMYSRLEIQDETGNALPVSQLPSRRALDTKQQQEGVTVYKLEGEKRWSHTKSTPIINDQGEVELVVNIMHDITSQRLSEQHKDEFIAIASHELKTPLTSMRAYAQKIVRDAKKRQAGSKELFGLELIARQTERLQSLVEKILDVSKLNAGAMVLHVEKMDLGQLVLTTAERLGAMTSGSINVKAPKGIMVEADPTRIEQVLVNLINNAIAYSPPGSPVDIQVSEQAGQAVIKVTDRGPGIRKSDREKVFERFSRLATGGRGMGLGLYIVKQIVDQHGGQIEIDSEPGQGSAFIIKLLAVTQVANLKRLIKKDK